jgi:hypothetical protein
MRYGSAARKMFKIRWGLHDRGLVEDHHVIPRRFRNHPIVQKSNYDVNESKNLVMMPTRLGKHLLKLREDRLFHEGNHAAYNAYVGNMLDVMDSTYDFELFVEFLKRGCRRNSHHIPWF